MGIEERREKECEGHAHIAFVAPVGLRLWLRCRRHRRCFPLQMIVNLTGRHPPRLHEPAPPPEMLALFIPPLCQQKMEGTDDAQRKGNQTKEEIFGAENISFIGPNGNSRPKIRFYVENSEGAKVQIEEISAYLCNFGKVYQKATLPPRFSLRNKYCLGCTSYLPKASSSLITHHSSLIT
ncbi:hypothetical protein VIGAN_08279000 [Vigna angularis var. angularis]|uniref:Uncharacterized protein n=1 Tax=Vigna angularis var. angularis TaxID=157739 RepID=A0A0S3SSZ0_PHAAN|nr:hypothetical protein VIGAN_08279000 [Vigna angularis var. angularis]